MKTQVSEAEATLLEKQSDLTNTLNDLPLSSLQATGNDAHIESIIQDFQISQKKLSTVTLEMKETSLNVLEKQNNLDSLITTLQDALPSGLNIETIVAVNNPLITTLVTNVQSKTEDVTQIAQVLDTIGANPSNPSEDASKQATHELANVLDTYLSNAPSESIAPSRVKKSISDFIMPNVTTSVNDGYNLAIMHPDNTQDATEKMQKVLFFLESYFLFFLKFL